MTAYLLHPMLRVRSHHRRAFQKIIACIDLSETAQEVVATACRIALKDSATVDFLHVWRETWVVTPHQSDAVESTCPALAFTPAERQAYIEYLHRELHEFIGNAAQGITSSETLHESMNHGNGIMAYAQEYEADLIIAGGKGRTNLRYLPMGSTAEGLLPRLPCSILAVKTSPKNLCA